MKQPKPVKAWAVVVNGEVRPYWCFADKRAGAAAARVFKGEILPVLITPIVKKPRKAKGKKR